MPHALVGGSQITVDLAGAFGAGKLIDVVIEWRQQAKCVICHDDTQRTIAAAQGVRQRCAVAPTPWLVYSHLISMELAAAIGTPAACELLSIFADDYHCSTQFHTLCTLCQLETRLSHVGVLLRILL